MFQGHLPSFTKRMSCAYQYQWLASRFVYLFVHWDVNCWRISELLTLPHQLKAFELELVDARGLEFESWLPQFNKGIVVYSYSTRLEGASMQGRIQHRVRVPHTPLLLLGAWPLSSPQVCSHSSLEGGANGRRWWERGFPNTPLPPHEGSVEVQVTSWPLFHMSLSLS